MIQHSNKSAIYFFLISFIFSTALTGANQKPVPKCLRPLVALSTSDIFDSSDFSKLSSKNRFLLALEIAGRHQSDRNHLLFKIDRLNLTGQQELEVLKKVALADDSYPFTRADRPKEPIVSDFLNWLASEDRISAETKVDILDQWDIRSNIFDRMNRMNRVLEGNHGNPPDRGSFLNWMSLYSGRLTPQQKSDLFSKAIQRGTFFNFLDLYDTARPPNAEVVLSWLRGRSKLPIDSRKRLTKGENEFWQWLSSAPEEKIKELIEVSAEAGFDVFSFFRTKKTFSPDEIYRLVLLSARGNPEVLLPHLSKFKLTEPQGFEIAQLAREADEKSLKRLLPALKLTAKHRFDLARKQIETESTARQGSYSGYDIVARYHIQNQQDRFDLAKYVAELNPSPWAVAYISEAFELTQPQRDKIYRVSFGTDPATHLSQFTGHAIDPNSPHENLADGFHSAITHFAETHPEIIPPKWVSILWDRVKKQATGYGILRLLYESTKYDVKKRVPKDSLAVLLNALGMTAETLKPYFEHFSENRLGTFYELALDIKGNSPNRPFEEVSWDPRLFDRTHSDSFIRLLCRLRNLLHVRGNTEQAWGDILTSLKIRNATIDPESIESISKAAEAMVVDGIKKMFGEEDLHFTYEQFESLENKWGDTEPFITLISRYQGNSQWRNLLPLLTKMFRSELNHEFETTKFFGDKDDPEDQRKAAEQMGMFTSAEQIGKWIKIRNRAEIFSSTVATGVTTHEKLGNIHALVKRQLDNHLGVVGHGRAAEHDAIVTILTREGGGDPLAKYDEMMSGPLKNRSGPEARNSILTTAFHWLSHCDNLEEMRRGVKALERMAGPLQIGDDALNDLRAIRKDTQNVAQAKGTALLLTTTFHDLKSLLTVGNLVPTSSCQDYAKGTHIGSLPGYAIDANVQGIASFVAEPRHFRSAADFERALNLVATGKLTLRYNGGKRNFTLLPDDHSTPIETLTIEHAFRRNMLKLGKSPKGRPALELEPAYIQNHSAQEQMDKQIQSIYTELSLDIDADNERPAEMVRTRNVKGGVYSDLAKGIQYGDYTLPPSAD